MYYVTGVYGHLALVANEYSGLNDLVHKWFTEAMCRIVNYNNVTRHDNNLYWLHS